MKKQTFPKGWDAERVRRVIRHYDKLSENEAVAEDEAAFESPGVTRMDIPTDMVPKIRSLLTSRTK